MVAILRRDSVRNPACIFHRTLDGLLCKLRKETRSRNRRRIERRARPDDNSRICVWDGECGVGSLDNRYCTPRAAIHLPAG